MKQNRFTESYQIKSDSELESILNSSDKDYVEEARLTAKWILEDRNGNPEETNSANNKIIEKNEQIGVRQEKTLIENENDIKETRKKSPLTDNPSAPPLHSKKVITAFSVIFSTIFGTVLLMQNMRQTNNQKGRIQVLIFGILWTIVTVLAINSIELKTNSAIIFNLIGAGILSEYFWNKFIGKEFEYRKRSWVKPAIISAIITIAFILVLIYG